MAAKPVPSPALQAKYDDFAVQQEKMKSLVRKQEQLTSSKTETDMVNSELEGLKPEEPLYKLMGKMLVRQEVGEARANVSQRVNLIERELEKLEKQLNEQQALISTKRSEIQQLQQEEASRGAMAGRDEE